MCKAVKVPENSKGRELSGKGARSIGKGKDHEQCELVVTNQTYH